MSRATPTDLAPRALAWLETLRRGPDGYAMTPQLEGSLFTACFGLFLRRMLGDDDPAQRRALAERLLASQDPDTGLWLRLGNHADPARLHDRAHVDRQLSGYALSALQLLGAAPRHPLRFLEPWRTPAGIRAELARLPWARSPSNAGNRAMFLGTFLGCEAERGAADAAEALAAWFEWHDAAARAGSGFWGAGRFADGYLGLTGAAHQYVLYAWARREPPRLDRALERTLALQYRDGRFWPVPGGGSCYELDAVQVLLTAHRLRPAQRPAIEAAARRVCAVVMECFDPAGGFCWARRRPDTLRGALSDLPPTRRPLDLAWAVYMRLKAARRRTPEHRATAWAEGAHPVSEPSLFDTWFRLLTLAQVARMAPEIETPQAAWRSLATPNWGHF